MASRVIQFIWTRKQDSGAVDVQAFATVAALTEKEWVTVRKTADWLSERNRTIVVDLTETNATGGDIHDLKAALQAMAERFNYPSYGVDCPILLKHGILRK